MEGCVRAQKGWLKEQDLEEENRRVESQCEATPTELLSDPLVVCRSTHYRGLDKHRLPLYFHLFIISL